MSDERRVEGEGAGGGALGTAGQAARGDAGGATADADHGASRETLAEARFVELEIKLAEMEFGQHQIDEVVLRQGDDIRRLSALVRQLGDRLEAVLGESASAGGTDLDSTAAGRRLAGAGRDEGEAGERADPSVDPERPPHYSGPA